MTAIPRFTTSWDDGHPLDMRLATRLAHYGLPATFYIPCRNSRPVLDRACVRELAASFEIGAHTMSHINLRAVPAALARAEIFDSKRYIEDITGVACGVFAPPGGKFRPIHRAMVREAGFSGMRTVEWMRVDEPAGRAGLVEIATSLQMFPHRPLAYLRNAVRRLRPRNAITYFRRVHGRSLVQATELLLDAAAVEGGIFHLWGHSWELDEAGLWPVLDNILELLRTRASGFQPVSNGELCLETSRNAHPTPTAPHPEMS